MPCCSTVFLPAANRWMRLRFSWGSRARGCPYPKRPCESVHGRDRGSAACNSADRACAALLCGRKFRRSPADLAVRQIAFLILSSLQRSVEIIVIGREPAPARLIGLGAIGGIGGIGVAARHRVSLRAIACILSLAPRRHLSTTQMGSSQPHLRILQMAMCRGRWP